MADNRDDVKEILQDLKDECDKGLDTTIVVHTGTDTPQ